MSEKELECRLACALVRKVLVAVAAHQHETPFDLMYDDIDQAHGLLARSGFEVTEIERGEIHDSFWGAAPEGFRVRINSSHASDRPV